jgi:hypothetical protein
MKAPTHKQGYFPLLMFPARKEKNGITFVLSLISLCYGEINLCFIRFLYNFFAGSRKFLRAK